MPTIHDCEICTKDCPQRQLAIEQAEKHMYVSNELVSLQKEIEAGTLVRTVHSHWMWNKFSGAVRCKNCKSVVGSCFSELSLNSIVTEHKYCYNCGAKMLDRVDTARGEEVDAEVRRFFETV